MVFLIYLFVFFLGLIVGSFLNSVIYRLNSGESFLFKRSFCPHCRHILNFEDLIPLLSFLILKGKCRYCKKPISWQYPLVEISTALIFLLIFQLTAGNQQLTTYHLLNFSYLLIISCFLIVIFVYDLKHYLIPDKVIYPAIAITFLYQLFRALELEDWNLLGILNPLLSAVLASAFFLTIVLISRGRWMGVGDIKLAFFMGLLLGWSNILVALFLAFFIGAIIGVGLIIFGKKTLKSEVPFGPFLVTGTFSAMFFGKEIVNWYLALFLL